MSREDVEWWYKSTNRMALSDDDNIKQRVNDAFLKGEGLENITVNGKTYKGLLFDENSEQSKLLNKNPTFKTYYNNYLSCMKEIIKEESNVNEIDTKAISETLKDKLGKPNFSDVSEIRSCDYYGLMGGTQNVKVDFEVDFISKGECNLKTTMYINDWYGADEDDVNKKIDYKNIAITTAYAMSNPTDYINIANYKKNMDNIKSNLKSLIPGLQELFYLQHHYGCKPFPTQIIYKSTDKIKIDR